MTDPTATPQQPTYLSPRSWEERRLSVEAMPGTETEYLLALQDITDYVHEHRPMPDQFEVWLSHTKDIGATYARHIRRFLVNSGLLQLRSGILDSGIATQTWLETKDASHLLAQIHSTTKFIGELLVALTEPKSKADAKDYANERFGFEWETPAPVDTRLKWFQNADMAIRNDEGLWEITQAGSAFLNRIKPHPPIHTRNDCGGLPLSDTAAEASPIPTGSVAALTEELREASTDGSNYVRFELAVRESFEYLGFDSLHLGKAGNTDVLLTALLGKENTYSVAVDAKASANGNLKDPQVDWATLTEHRTKHDTDYSLLIGPNPSGKRILERSVEYGIVVISADDLAALVEQHSRLPLGLHTYRSLFQSPGFADTGNIDEAAEEQLRLGRILELTLGRVRSLGKTHGPVSARDIHMSLHSNDLGELDSAAVSQEDIQAALEVLANPLLRIIETRTKLGETPDFPPKRYFPSASNAVARQQLDLVARFVDPPDEDAEAEPS